MRHRYISTVIFALPGLLHGCADPSTPSEAPGAAAVAQNLDIGPYLPCDRAFDGFDPYGQPAPTTDYHGSGDLDLDGEVTQEDAALADAMVGHPEDWVSRADVDGNGVVGASDRDLISAAASGATLSGWWDRLQTREQREYWLTQVLALDQGYYYKASYEQMGGYVCNHHARQMYAQLSYYGCDLTHSYFNGNGTRFNLPIYMVSVNAPNFLHAINAVLVGDDPLSIEDWAFIEPQGNAIVVPGDWSIPPQATLSIRVPSNLFVDDSSVAAFERVRFEVAADLSVSRGVAAPGVVLSRPEPRSPVPGSRTVRNPRFVPVGAGRVLYDAMRDDLSRATDLHLASLSPTLEAQTAQATPLVGDTNDSRLLEATRGPDGTVHLLFSGKPVEPYGDNDLAEAPGLFYARLDPIAATLSEPLRIGASFLFAEAARIRVADDGAVYAFWLESYRTHSGARPQGIYWARVFADSAGPPELVQSFDISSEYNIAGLESTGTRDRMPYLFDADVRSATDATVLYTRGRTFEYSPGPPEEMSWNITSPLNAATLDGATWSEPVVLDSGNVAGVQMARDATGRRYAAYWKRADTEDERGTLSLTSNDGSGWSAPTTVDASDKAAYASIAAKPGGGVFLAWERQVGERVLPVLAECGAASCGAGQLLDVRAGADAWQPRVAPLAGLPTVIWSSRSADAVLMELYQKPANLGDVNASGTVDIVDALLVAQHYVGLHPDPFVLAAADVNCSGTVDIVDALLVAQYYVGLIPAFDCNGVFLESGGQVVMEAEHFDVNTAQGKDTPLGEHRWTLTADASASGGQLMAATPNNNALHNADYVANAPRLDYQVKFATPGTYYVWLRGTGGTADDDSCHVGLEGAAVDTADRISQFGLGSLGWSKTTMDGPQYARLPATVTIDQAGIVTVNVWMREDGFKLDKIVLTTNPNYTPSGAGPGESAQGR
ncbi:MAG: hypothetical protein JW940_17055 [Polyangiaceae bacterium]|nr:hypothetical protein [Polyangiaceae bacterium]